MSDKPDRQEMAAELLRRGQASLRELLTASFGEWPPKGLDIDHKVTHDQQVTLRSVSGMKKLGWASFLAAQPEIKIDEQEIQSQAAKISTTLISTMGHEAAHILQQQGIEKTGDFKTDITKISSNAIMKELTDQENKRFGTQLKHVFNRFNKRSRSENQELDYLKEGDEMQARLHEVLAAGYQRWGKLPSNRDELWMALENCGITSPLSVHDHLRSLPKESSAWDFARGKNDEKEIFTAFSLWRVSNSLPSSLQDKLWKETLPALYVDLIGMYGDRNGRNRFNVSSPNKEPVIRAKNQRLSVNPA